MFRNRTTTRKPNDELISKFRKSFPNVVSDGSMPGDNRHDGSVNPAAVEGGMHDRFENDHIKHHDTTPKGLQDVRFTPSVLDLASYQFMDFANQPPGYYTPTAGGLTTMYHHQAGDLHTPIPYNLATPPSIPNTIPSSLPVDPNGDINLDYQNMQNQFMPQQFQNIDSFTEQAGFAANSYMHQDSAYDSMDRSDESSMDQMAIPGAQPMNMMMPNVGFSEEMDMSAETHGEKFRYGVSLRAPTAMIKQSDEIPVTYLNKGQAYSLSVVDTTPHPPSSQPCKYRTYIRVSFEDEQQRSKPSACWQLWKEGRGLNEAYQRGGKLLAVEYVDPNQSGEEGQRNSRVELEHASFDGFCVTWTANPATGNADCALSVRFNFLSTDFSHSKGVKGIPVRFCAKTEVLTPNDAVTGLPTSEVSYCKVKLFRDHGAERKLSNDIAHVKKNMEKLKQQIAQMEMGGGNIGKRKRSNVSIATKVSDNRPVKLSKHKRTWSIDSQEGGGKLSPEDDLHYRYSMLQDMFSSTRPISVLNLRGDDLDDPDLYPVSLPGDTAEQKFERLSRQNTGGSLHSVNTAPGVSSIMSPTNSSVSLNSPLRPAERQLPNHASGHNESMDWSNINTQSSTISQPVKVKKNATTGYIEAIDIDPTYKPPSECPPKPIACFYVRFPSGQGDDYYRAVYLTERTVHDLMQKISEKYQIETDRIVRILRINHNGLKIKVDDDVVQHLPEGQDMVAEFSDASKFDIPTPDIGTPTSAIEVNLKY